MRNNKLDIKLGNLKNSKNLSHIRITLDHTEDLELIKKIIFQINKRPILLHDILNLVTTQSDLLKINEHISNNEGMQKSLEQDRYFKN